MSSRICHLCGNPATGLASTWSANEGARWYCHGDEDPSPTCYERREWPEPSRLLDPPATYREEWRP